MRCVEILTSLFEKKLGFPQIYETIFDVLLNGFEIEIGAVFACHKAFDFIEPIAYHGIEPEEERIQFNRFAERLSARVAHLGTNQKDPFFVLSPDDLTTEFVGTTWEKQFGGKYFLVPLSYENQLRGFIIFPYNALEPTIGRDMDLLYLCIRNVHLLFERACLQGEFAGVRGEVSYQRKSIDALLSITKPEADFITIEKIFQKAIGPVQEITGFSTVTARLYDPDRKCFRLMAHAGMTPEMVKNLNCISDDNPIFLEIIKKKEPAVKTPVKFVQELGYKRTIFVPLVSGDAVIGSIDLPTKSDYFPTEDEFRWFALVGRMLGSMIYQAQLTERLQSMAVIQERTRLANELHDEFSQIVRSMKWGLEEARITLENKQLEQTDETLEKLETMVQHTVDYLREEMLSLRERVDSSEGIIPIFEGMLLRFERNWGIKTKFMNEMKVATNHTIFLSSNTEIQLIRIVQEALMNIRRHANAHMVTIKVAEDMDSMVFSIIDDGIGFNLEDIPHERLGLRIIRERASGVGAMVRIDSIKGAGTILRIEVPNYLGVAPL